MTERKSHFDIHFTPIATELGKLVYAWNELHEHLGHLFDFVINPKMPGAALAAWRAVENDRTQRTMLRFSVEHAAHRIDKATLDEILWVLEKANSLTEHRNNAIHSPYAVFTGTDGKTEILPLDFFGNPRARKLGGKDLIAEFQWCYACAQTLSGYAVALGSSLVSGLPMPDRPTMPERLPKEELSK